MPLDLSTASAALVAAVVAAVLALAGLLVALRLARTVQDLRLLAEQGLAGSRAEAETTRATLAAVERALAASVRAASTDTADRLTASGEKIAALRQDTRDTLAELRTVLARGAGELNTGIETVRTTLADGQTRAGAALAQQFDGTRSLLETKLREMREGNEAKLAEIQRSVNEQLNAAVEKQMQDSFARVIDQFTAVQKAMGDVQAVTAQIGDIKRLFGNVKTRGGWGETQVRAMLDDVLPPGSYEANRRLREGSDEAVDFALLMPRHGADRLWLPIDAKFPVEDYERLLAASEVGDLEAERAARRGLEQRIRLEARKIQQKYICPPVTVEFAVLYLPTDGLYAEVARIPGMIDELGRVNRVLVLGPSVFPALLRTIHLGHVTLALSEKADLIGRLLGATRAEMLKMDEVLGRLSKQAGTFGSTIDRARSRARIVAKKLRGLESVDAAEADQLLELDAPGLAPGLGEEDL